MNRNLPPENQKSLVDKGFDFDKRVNHVLIAAGLGVAAVGSIIAAPAVVTFGALTTGGSIAGLAVTDRLKDGYETMKAKRTAKLGKKVAQDNFQLAA